MIDEILRDNRPTAQTKTLSIKAPGELFCELVRCGGEGAREKTLIMGNVMHLNSGDTGYLPGKLLQLLRGLELSAMSASPSIAATTISGTRETPPVSQAAPHPPQKLLKLSAKQGMKLGRGAPHCKGSNFCGSLNCIFAHAVGLWLSSVAWY